MPMLSLGPYAFLIYTRLPCLNEMPIHYTQGKPNFIINRADALKQREIKFSTT